MLQNADVLSCTSRFRYIGKRAYTCQTFENKLATFYEHHAKNPSKRLRAGGPRRQGRGGGRLHVAADAQLAQVGKPHAHRWDLVRGQPAELKETLLVGVHGAGAGARHEALEHDDADLYCKHEPPRGAL